MKNKPKEKIKVIYFTGSGRSGSTILNIILDNHPEIFGGGELQNMGAVFNDKKTCSCGEATVNCEFWSQVMQDWKEKISDSTIKEGLSKWKKIESYHSLKAWFRLWAGLSLDSPEVKDYLDNTYAFFEALKKYSGKSTIVDISKNPLRAWALLNHPDIDLRLVHLVRDGRGVAWSLEKKAKREGKPRSIFKSALFWLLVNKQSNYVRKQAKDALLIRYEDFAQHPEQTIKHIAAFSSFDPTPVIDIISGNGSFNISHVMGGNSIRKANTIKLKFDDDEWTKNLKTDYQKKFYAITRSTMETYGYN